MNICSYTPMGSYDLRGTNERFKLAYKYICYLLSRPSGGGGGGVFDATVDFSVNVNPNTGGTTFNPNTPALTTVLYVSTIDNSQWVYRSGSYVTYVSPFWTLSGNPSVGVNNFIGSTNNAALKFRTNNVQVGVFGTNGNFGVNVASPSEKLEVAGNVRYSGALMPNNSAGTAGQLLASGGASGPNTWVSTTGFWNIAGNAGTSGLGVVGTTDTQPLNIITDNVSRINIGSTGFIGLGTVANGTDRLLVSGTSLTAGTIKTNAGISIGSTPPSIGSYKIYVEDAGTVRTRTSTTSDPAAGLGRAFHEVNYNSLDGWRYGLNTGGVAGGYTPSMDFTIDELSSGTFRNVFRIQKTTGYVGIFAGSNIGNTIITPTEQLDVGGNIRCRGAFMPGNSAGTSGYKLISQGAGLPPIWVADPSGSGITVDEETPSGTIDGVNAVFTLAQTPLSGTTKLYVRGSRLKRTVDYTIATNVITIINALWIPGTGDTIVIDYKY